MGTGQTIMNIVGVVGGIGGLLYIVEKAVGIDVINMVPVFPLIKAKKTG